MAYVSLKSLKDCFHSVHVYQYHIPNFTSSLLFTANMWSCIASICTFQPIEEENKKSDLYEHIKDSKEHYDAQTLDVATTEQQEEQPIIKPETESGDSEVEEDTKMDDSETDDKLEVSHKAPHKWGEIIFTLVLQSILI